MSTLPLMTILGDSRVFDTYYVNGSYGSESYGYDRTFPHLLRARLLGSAPPFADAVHIPDHFRGRTVVNNIIRLALTNPSLVVLLDGIWETLITRRHLAEHLSASTDSTDIDKLTPSDIVTIYKSGKLALSPQNYAERIANIVSFFTRRRRAVVWMTTPQTSPAHKDGLHYAGDYRPLAGWHEILVVLNEVVTPIAVAAGATILDLNSMMKANGGDARCLIDLWHFTPAFHEAIANELYEIARQHLKSAPQADARIMVPGHGGNSPAYVIGSHAERELAIGQPYAGYQALPGDAEKAVPGLYVLAEEPGNTRDVHARRLLERNPHICAIAYPEELRSISNPIGYDREQHGSLK